MIAHLWRDLDDVLLDYAGVIVLFDDERELQVRFDGTFEIVERRGLFYFGPEPAEGLWERVL